jgi:glucose-1-phosphate thymidylyltransferase
LKQHQVDDDLIVVAGDNLFSQSLEDFGRFCRSKQAPAVAVYDVKDLEQIKKYNALTLLRMDGSRSSKKNQDSNQHRHRHRALYYPKATLPLISQYVAEGNNPDQPGRLVQWLYPRTPVYLDGPGIWATSDRRRR